MSHGSIQCPINGGHKCCKERVGEYINETLAPLGPASMLPYLTLALNLRPRPSLGLRTRVFTLLETAFPTIGYDPITIYGGKNCYRPTATVAKATVARSRPSVELPWHIDRHSEAGVDPTSPELES